MCTISVRAIINVVHCINENICNLYFKFSVYTRTTFVAKNPDLIILLQGGVTIQGIHQGEVAGDNPPCRLSQALQTHYIKFYTYVYITPLHKPVYVLLA